MKFESFLLATRSCSCFEVLQVHRHCSSLLKCGHTSSPIIFNCFASTVLRDLVVWQFSVIAKSGFRDSHLNHFFVGVSNQNKSISMISMSSISPTGAAEFDLTLRCGQGVLRREVDRVLNTYWRGREGYAISATWCYVYVWVEPLM